MKRSDTDPARRAEGDPGDAMTDDFVPAVRDDAGDEVDSSDEAATGSSVTDAPSSSAGSDAERMLSEQHDR